jgi:hypothetical protein
MAMYNKLLTIIVVLLMVGSFFFGRASVDMPEITTINERDTASYSKPLPDTVEKVTTIYIKVPERDTTPKDDVADSVSVEVGERDSTEVVVERDSTEVAVDIERKVYEDERYKATISGPRIGEYSPVLESIDIYTQSETRVVQQPVKWIRPYVSALAGKDVLGIGGGVMIKERVSLGVKYMRFHNKDVVGAEMGFLF